MSSIIFNIPETINVITYKIVNEHVTEGRDNVKKVTIPKHIQRIDFGAFHECEFLEEVIFEQGSLITEIGKFAFSKCTSLKRINLPKSIVTIDRYAFAYCPLKEINLPQTLTEISDCVFFRCESLKQIILPNSITRIGHGAFYFCESLVYAYLPNSIQIIMKTAFSYCKRLSVIAAPSSTRIHHQAFEGCDIINQVSKCKKVKQRFNNLPLHQMCYDPAITIDSLTAFIEQMNEDEYTNVDAFYMNALHILCSNPSATDEMISFLVHACPHLRSMQSTLKTTPVIVYIKSKYGDDIKKVRLSLDDFLSSRKLREDNIVRLLAFDDEMQEELRKLHGEDEEVKDFYPFMEIVSNKKYSLESIYWLLGEHPYILANLCPSVSTSFRTNHNEIEELKKQNRDMMKELDGLKEQNKAIMSNNASMKRSRNRMKEKMKKQKRNMEEMKNQLIDVRNELDELKEQNKAITKNNACMKRCRKRCRKHETDGTFTHE